MTVLCSTTAGEGHFGPLKTLGVACQAVGHEVRVATPVSFSDTVQRAACATFPLPEPSAAAIGTVFAALSAMGPEEANRTVMAEVFGRFDAQTALPGVQAVIGTWRPDMVLREPAEFASSAAAEAAGIPQMEVAIAVAALMQWASPPDRPVG